MTHNRLTAIVAAIIVAMWGGCSAALRWADRGRESWIIYVVLGALVYACLVAIGLMVWKISSIISKDIMDGIRERQYWRDILAMQRGEGSGKPNA